jgi:hypothetical protein
MMSDRNDVPILQRMLLAQLANDVGAVEIFKKRIVEYVAAPRMVKNPIQPCGI